MRYLKTKLAVCLALSLPLATFAAITIPSAGTPGGALPVMPEPFSTKLPSTLAPLTQEYGATPTVDNPSDFQFVVNKIEVLGISKYSEVDSLEVNKLAESLRQKYLNKNGELSVKQLQTITDALTTYFAQQGYFLTKVYLPPQDISHERIVHLQVREGFLEKINIQGQTIYTQAQLEEPFKKYLGHPITAAEIESGLLTLRNYPGIEVNSVFAPGENPAGTVMNIQITESDRFNVLASANNYGNNVTGQYQGMLSAHAYNLIHGADDLGLTFLQKTNPTNSEYYAAEYTRNFFFPRTQINTGYSYNRYTLGDTLVGLGLGGISQIYHVNLIQNFIQSRTVEFSGNIGLNHEMGYLKQNSDKLNQDKITYAEASLSAQFNFSRLNLVNVDEVAYEHGFNSFLDAMGVAPDGNLYPSRQGGSGAYAEGEFNLTSLSVNLYQQPDQYNLIELKMYGQYSPDLLTSFSQLSFGGQNALPAYDTSEYLMDSGVTAHLEWKFPIPGLTNRVVPKTSYHFGDLLHLGIFTDYGNGWLNDPSSDEAGHVALSDYGLGIYLSLGTHLQIEAIAARHYPSSVEPQDEESTRYWVGMNYVYTRF